MTCGSALRRVGQGRALARGRCWGAVCGKAEGAIHVYGLGCQLFARHECGARAPQRASIAATWAAATCGAVRQSRRARRPAARRDLQQPPASASVECRPHARHVTRPRSPRHSSMDCLRWPVPGFRRRRPRRWVRRLTLVGKRINTPTTCPNSLVNNGFSDSINSP